MARDIGNEGVINQIRLKNQSDALSGDPASGYSWLYVGTGTATSGLRLELDSGSVLKYLDEAEVNDLIAGTAPTTQAGSYLISGGNVIWESGLVFRVSAAHYVIQSTSYTSSESTITLDVADATNPRIDVIAVDTTGTIVKITGTPSSDPLKPDIDPHTQLELSFVLVGATVTEPAGVSNTNIYLENDAPPTEWISTGSASFNANSSNNPHAGSKCIEVTNGANGNYIRFQASVAISLATQEYLILYIRNKAAWASTKSIRAEWRLNGVLVGARATIDNGLWGFSDSLVGSYQVIAIPIPTFAVPSTSYVNQLYISIVGAGGNLGLYIDDLVLQGGVAQTQIGLTQEQADARYVQLPDVRSISYVIDGNGSAIPTGTAGVLEIPFGCTINRATMLTKSSTARTAVVEIWKDVYANHPPTIADKITASAPLILYTGTKYQDSTLTGWTTAITAGDVLLYQVNSPTDATWLLISLKVTRI